MSEYFTINDFEMLKEWGGQRYDKTNSIHREAAKVFKENAMQVMYKWASAVKNVVFPNGYIDHFNSNIFIRTRYPKFREYIWVRIYPDKESPKNLVYELSINSKGILRVALGVFKADKSLEDKYVKIRNSHIIEKNLSVEEALALSSIEKLTEWTIRGLNEFDLGYNDVADELGLTSESELINTEAEVIGSSTHMTVLPSDMNTILYGPPGTGKTFQLQKKYFPLFTGIGRKTKKQFAEELVTNLSWWQAVTVAMYDMEKPVSVTEILTHPIVIAKATKAYNKTPRNSVWSSLQIHTKEECAFVKYSQRTLPLVFSKDQNSMWHLDRKAIEIEFPELVKAKDNLKSFLPVESEIRRYRFVTFHQSFCYEDFVEGIKPILTTEAMNQDSGQIAYEVKPGIFKELAIAAMEDPNNNYALFIDEINRGNVANIFGELITFIEKDKRLDKNGKLDTSMWKVDHLPYSREPFGVPPNLYIIGTMNTADRSIEALDTALRRRFSFIPVYPNPELLRNRQPEDLDIKLDKLLIAINERLESLLDRDHTIGHSYFWSIVDSDSPYHELCNVFSNMIIPQLKEYFYGNPIRISMILGPEFIRRKASTVFMKADSDREDYDADERAVYEIVPSEEWTVEAFKSIYEK